MLHEQLNEQLQKCQKKRSGLNVFLVHTNSILPIEQSSHLEAPSFASL